MDEQKVLRVWLTKSPDATGGGVSRQPYLASKVWHTRSSSTIMRGYTETKLKAQLKLRASAGMERRRGYHGDKDERREDTKDHDVP